ncbi:MAG: PAS domain S-box protein, partial [Spirochaetota bacterium]
MEIQSNTIYSDHTTQLLLQIANLHNISASINEYISNLKKIMIEMHIPLFNISCLSNIEGTDLLLIFPEWNNITYWIPEIELNDNIPQCISLNIKKIISNRSLFKKSILFSLLRGYTIISDNLEISKTIRHNITTYPLNQILHDFSMANKELSQIMTLENQNKIISSSAFGGVISFPLFAEKDVIGSFDVVYPKSHLTIDDSEFAILELITKLIANGLRQYRYQNKIILSETKYNSLINAIPMAMFIINTDYTIIETNDTFKSLFGIKHPLNKKCYELIYFKNYPCEDCVAKRAIATALPITREQNIPCFGQSRFFKYIASPISAPSGNITAVVNILEDITTRIIAERKIEKFSLALADEVDKQTSELKEKQKKLELITHTLYSLKQANTIKESIHYITQSLNKLGAQYCVVTLHSTDVNALQVVDVFPDDFHHFLNKLIHDNIINIKLDFYKYTNIPFFSVIKTGKDILIETIDEIQSLIETTFPQIDTNNKNL